MRCIHACIYTWRRFFFLNICNESVAECMPPCIYACRRVCLLGRVVPWVGGPRVRYTYIFVYVCLNVCKCVYLLCEYACVCVYDRRNLNCIPLLSYVRAHIYICGGRGCIHACNACMCAKKCVCFDECVYIMIYDAGAYTNACVHSRMLE